MRTQKLTSRDVKQDLEFDLVFGEASVDEPADHGVQEDDEDGPQSRQEEDKPLVLRPPFCGIRTSSTDDIEHGQGSQPHGSVEGGARQALKRVDEDQVRSVARREARDAHHGGNLAHRNVDGGTSHESRERRERDNIDDPSTAGKADE